MSLLAETYYNRCRALGYTDENAFVRKLHMSLMEGDTTIYSGNIGRKGSVSADVVYFVDAKGTINDLTADEVVMVGDCDLTIGEIEADSVAIWAKKVRIEDGKIDELHCACDSFRCRAECDDKSRYGSGGIPYDLDAVTRQVKEDLADMADEIADDEDGDYGDLVVPNKFTARAYGGTAEECADQAVVGTIDIPEDVKLSMKILGAILGVEEVRESILQALDNENDISEVVRQYVETGGNEELLVVLSELPDRERTKALADFQKLGALLTAFQTPHATKAPVTQEAQTAAAPVGSPVVAQPEPEGCAQDDRLYAEEWAAISKLTKSEMERLLLAVGVSPQVVENKSKANLLAQMEVLADSVPATATVFRNELEAIASSKHAPQEEHQQDVQEEAPAEEVVENA